MYPYYRQLLLGPSLNKTLTIIDGEPSPPRPQLPKLGPAFILRLPDELLVSITEFAVFEEYRLHGCPYCRVRANTKAVKALSLVCQRFGKIAQPMLFHTITFEGTPSTVPPKSRVIRLHHTLQKNPTLRGHCRCLSISVNDFASTTTSSFAVANDLARWLTRVRCLENYGGFDKPNALTWALIRNLVQNMRDVQHWRLCREGWGLHLQQVLDEATFPKLVNLELHGISRCDTRVFQLEAEVSISRLHLQTSSTDILAQASSVN